MLEHYEADRINIVHGRRVLFTVSREAYETLDSLLTALFVLFCLVWICSGPVLFSRPALWCKIASVVWTLLSVLAVRKLLKWAEFY